MFSFRKRLRFDDDNLNLPVGHASSACDQRSQMKLDRLPVELYYIIFDYLSLDDILCLRATSAHFKHLIDRMALVWRRAALRFLPTHSSSGDLESLLSFYRLNASLDLIRISCPAVISKKALSVATPVQLEHIVSERQCALHVDQLNVMSYRMLNCFAAYGTELSIRSFVASQGLMATQTTKPGATNGHHSLHKFGQLRRLSLNLMRYDPRADTESDTLFVWPTCFSDNVLLNRLACIFPHVHEVHLSYYFDAGASLLDALCAAESLRVLGLRQSSFRSCAHETCSTSSPPRRRRQLKLNKLVLDSVSPTTANTCLAALADDVRLTQLDLFVSQFDDDLHPDQLLEHFSRHILANTSTLATNLFHIASIDMCRQKLVAFSCTNVSSLHLQRRICSSNRIESSHDVFNKRVCRHFKGHFDANRFVAIFGQLLNSSMCHLKRLTLQLTDNDDGVEQLLRFIVPKCNTSWNELEMLTLKVTKSDKSINCVNTKDGDELPLLDFCSSMGVTFFNFKSLNQCVKKVRIKLMLKNYLKKKQNLHFYSLVVAVYDRIVNFERIVSLQ